MVTVLESLNQALHHTLFNDERVILLGEDVLDPYGGAFKVTRGLSTAFPGRVLTTPISEAGIVGVATGMALRGLRPVVEIMFGDFLALAADQLINHLAKFRWMYNDQVRVPLVIRTPMGGRRGYGPTHSQTLEKHFLGVPGLRVLAPCDLGDPGALLTEAVLYNEGPTLFIENKLLYLSMVQDISSLNEFEITSYNPRESGSEARQAGSCQTYCLQVREAPAPTLTMAAYGYMVELARQAVLSLAYDHEIFTELVVITQLAPFEIGPILASARHSGRLMTVEEGTLSMGWGAEILARSAEALGPALQVSRRLAARDLPVPASHPLEEAVLPGVKEIIRAAKEIAPTSRY